MDLVSVVVPMYKVEKFLHDCIDSILSQSYDNFELILVNDGSPDKCGEIAEEYSLKDSRIKVIHKVNGGLSSARNAGIDNSNGKYIVFIDSDDQIKKNYLMELYRTITINDCDVVLCGYQTNPTNIDVAPKLLLNTIVRGKELILSSSNVHSNNDLCFTWRYMFKLEKSKQIRFNEKVLVGEDAIFNLEYLLESEKAIAIPNALYIYTVNNPESIMKTPYKANFESSLILQYEIKKKLSIKFGLLENKQYKKNLAEYYIKNVFSMLKNNLKNGPEADKIAGLKRLISYEMFNDSIESIGLKYKCENYKEYIYYLALKYRIFPILNKEFV